MRIGLVGYGLGGRYFHAPYIVAATGCELAGIVTRSPERMADAAQDFPDVPVFPSQTELLKAGVDAVAISTPAATRRELVLEAIDGGVHIVADKPFAPSAGAAQQLVDAAAAAGVMLSVYHNRRWDTDIVTLRSVLDKGLPGEVWLFESRFDLDDPTGIEAGPTGGLLLDLGSHLVDQAVWLFGPARLVSAAFNWLGDDQERIDAGFAVAITHTSGVHSHLIGSKMNHLISKELRLLGTRGSYVSAYSDVQTQAIFAGNRPVDDVEAWGIETPERWGTLFTSEGASQVPSEQGAYFEYYAQFAAAAAGRAAQPVPAAEVVEVLRVLDAVRRSAQTGQTVNV